jgi:hypothetical protein
MAQTLSNNTKFSSFRDWRSEHDLFNTIYKGPKPGSKRNKIYLTVTLKRAQQESWIYACAAQKT